MYCHDNMFHGSGLFTVPGGSRHGSGLKHHMVSFTVPNITVPREREREPRVVPPLSPSSNLGAPELSTS